MADTPSQPESASDGPPSGSAPGSGSAPPPSSSHREKALIEGALKQASPRPGTVGFSLRPRELLKDAIPGYEITREIHRGGQGVVYQAIQKKTGRKVAIKVVHGGPFTGQRERMRVEREVRILAGLDHPNIVKIHDSGEVNGSFFYVMDYVSGHSLDALITKDRKPVDEILKLFIDICEAVSAAHLKGVIHRDLKPGNIRIDNSGKPHVLDFGLAKLSIPDESDDTKPRLMTMTGQFVGSLPWASPEQAAGTPGAIDIRSDVYSLGVILYQLLTGQFPYQVIGQMREVLDHILKTEPARPSTIRKQINDEVETIVLKCLAKEPGRRYQSAGELARDLRRYLAGEPIEAKRDSGWYVITKTLRRHRAAVSVAAGFLILIVGFGIAMAVAWQREKGLKNEVQDRLAEVQAERTAKEAARAQAQSNFESVRELAHVFMHDFSEGIEDLRGATLVREKLLKTAQSALVKLADAAKTDETENGGKVNTDLLRELADAHDRVGDIKAGLYMPRAGQTAAGAENYAKARTIREKLLAASPQSPIAQSDIAESQRRSAQSLQRQRKFSDAREEFTRSLAGFDTAIALAKSLPPSEITRIKQDRMVTVQGGANLLVTMAAESSTSLEDADRLIEGALSRYDQVDTYWRGRLDAAPDDREPSRRLGIVADSRARAMTTLGRSHADAAIKALDAGRPEEASQLIIAALTKFFEAQRYCETAVSDFRILSHSRPQDAALRRDELIALYNIGDVCMRRGDAIARAAEKGVASRMLADIGGAPAAYSLAVGRFEAALTAAEDLVNSDHGNLEARRDLALVLNKLGNVLRDLGQLDRAASIFQRSLDLREDLWRTDPMQQHRYDLAVGLFKRAEIDRKRADTPESKAAPATRQALLESARNLFTRSLDAYTALKDAGVNIRDADITTVQKARDEAQAAQ